MPSRPESSIGHVPRNIQFRGSCDTTSWHGTVCSMHSAMAHAHKKAGDSLPGSPELFPVLGRQLDGAVVQIRRQQQRLASRQLSRIRRLHASCSRLVIHYSAPHNVM